MRRSEKARIVTTILNEEYKDRESLLHYSNPFELLIAVILSAQTTDAGVNMVTPQLFADYPSPRDLAQASQPHVEEIIHRTGFFRTKAANIIKTAGILDTDYSGEVPSSMQDLVALPGVGRKTANVIRHHIYGKAAIIVDTHFKRVAKRMGFTKLTDPQQIEKELIRLIPEEVQSDLSMTLNFHGRKYCHPRKPECVSCPVAEYCPSRQN